MLEIRYWNDAEQTDSVMKKDEDGTLWMCTGDKGIMDDEGYLKSMLFPLMKKSIEMLICLQLWEGPKISSSVVERYTSYFPQRPFLHDQ
jgi:acyl-CoA synthetase (AMP-forming)/AMP-acid ligase II